MRELVQLAHRRQGGIANVEPRLDEVAELEQAHAIEQKKLEAEFTKLDTNKDGQLSKAEFMAATPALKARVTPQQMIAQVDSNKDGKISLQEYEASPLGNFNKLDANHDGILEANELPGGRGKPITLKEYQENLRRQFHKLDRHHHSYLNAQELTAPPD